MAKGIEIVVLFDKISYKLDNSKENLYDLLYKIQEITLFETDLALLYQ